MRIAATFVAIVQPGSPGFPDTRPPGAVCCGDGDGHTAAARPTEQVDFGRHGNPPHPSGPPSAVPSLCAVKGKSNSRAPGCPTGCVAGRPHREPGEPTGRAGGRSRHVRACAASALPRPRRSGRSERAEERPDVGGQVGVRVAGGRTPRIRRAPPPPAGASQRSSSRQPATPIPAAGSGRPQRSKCTCTEERSSNGDNRRAGRRSLDVRDHVEVRGLASSGPASP